MSHAARSREKSLQATFQGYEGPVFAIRLWDGWQWSSSTSAPPVCTIVIETPEILEDLIAAPDEITLGEAFIHGDLDVQGDIFSVFAVAEHLLNRPQTLRSRLAGTLLAAALDLKRFATGGSRHSQARDRAAISHHYDQPVDFFRPWLGRTLAYSCACFRDAGDSLDRAQEQKFALICRKLRLQPGERFLDIGCGWGGLLLFAASQCLAEAHGITLSREQFDETNRRIRQAQLESRCHVLLQDYRSLGQEGHPFDKIASVGMFEHVGLENMRRYFRAARASLKPGGVFLNHGIARAAGSLPRRRSFIDRYVFPDGQLVTLSQALQAAEAEGFEVRDVENLREHYELTLRQWVAGLQSHANALLALVPVETYRIWLLYMAGSAASFRRGDIAVYQTLLSRPDKGRSGLPLTREDWFSSQPDHSEVHAGRIP